MTDAPKNDIPVDQPPPVPALTEAETRAAAARTNAFMDLAKVTGQLIRQAVSIAKLDMMATRTILVPAAPADLMAVIESQEHRIKQLEIGFGALVDMILAVDLVAAVDNPDYKPDDTEGVPMAPKILKSAEITKEHFFLVSAISAERTAAMLQRGLLSGGGVSGAVAGIIRKQ